MPEYAVELAVRDSDGYEHRYVRDDDDRWWLFDTRGRTEKTSSDVVKEIVGLIRDPPAADWSLEASRRTTRP